MCIAACSLLGNCNTVYRKLIRQNKDGWIHDSCEWLVWHKYIMPTIQRRVTLFSLVFVSLAWKCIRCRQVALHYIHSKNEDTSAHNLDLFKVNYRADSPTPNTSACFLNNFTFQTDSKFFNVNVLFTVENVTTAGASFANEKKYTRTVLVLR